MGRVNFIPGSRVRVTLRSAQGQTLFSTIRGQRQVCFLLVDGRRMYLPEAAAAAIVELGIRDGETIVVCLLQSGAWDIRREQPRRFMVYREAFAYCVRAVNEALAKHGEHWDDVSRQAAVSTMLIQMRNDGVLR